MEITYTECKLKVNKKNKVVWIEDKKVVETVSVEKMRKMIERNKREGAIRNAKYWVRVKGFEKIEK